MQKQVKTKNITKKLVEDEEGLHLTVCNPAVESAFIFSYHLYGWFIFICQAGFTQICMKCYTTSPPPRACCHAAAVVLKFEVHMRGHSMQMCVVRTRISWGFV